MGIPVIPTFHPAYILRQQSREAISKAKWEVWRDMEKVLAIVRQQ
jgi:uracil-DNA glycosylase